MSGTQARNFHEGSRSEIIADYLFSSWGTVTPARRQDDHGIDLYCTLCDSVGQRWRVTDYYSVQVKSNTKSWIFSGNDAVTWLLDYPTPLFLACISKSRGVLSIYQTMARFSAGLWGMKDRLELVPSTARRGKCMLWPRDKRIGLSAPILRITFEDLLKKKRLAHLRKVLQFWVAADERNCAMWRAGLTKFQMPYEYRVNEVPKSTTVSQSVFNPTPERMRLAKEMTSEVLECVGPQLLDGGDRTSALYAALLLRQLEAKQSARLGKDSRKLRDSGSTSELMINREFNNSFVARKSPFDALDKVTELIRSVPELSSFLSSNPATNSSD